MRYEFPIDSLNKSEKVIFSKDLLYRTHIEINYKDEKKSEVNNFLYFFCSYQNNSKLRKQIFSVFESGVYDFSSMSYFYKFHKLCEIYSKNIKIRYKKKKSIERYIKSKYKKY